MAQKLVKTTDRAGNPIAVASDEAILLLRRMVKLMESNAVTDSSMRQRVMLDASLGASATPLMTVALANNVTGGGVGYSIGSAVMTFGSNNLNSIDSRFFMMDTARNAYANGIRSKLVWS